MRTSMDSEVEENLSDVIVGICEVMDIIPAGMTALFTGQGEERPAEMTLYREATQNI